MVLRWLKNRPKLQRASGGVSLLVNEKSPLCNCITDMCLKLNDTLWVELNIPHCDKTIIIGVIYNPPVGSRYKDIYFFENLETTIMNINTKRPKSIMLIGDFNAHTGNLEDTLEYNNEDDSEELKTVHYLETANAATQRSNTDTVTNSYGPKLIKFCKKYEPGNY